MTVMEIGIKTIHQLPEDATWEDIQERINFVAGVRKGLRELDEGKDIAHQKVKEEFSEWLQADLVSCRPRTLRLSVEHCARVEKVKQRK